MIVNFDLAFPSMVTLLQTEKELEFTLTGSRFFGGVTSESDWDFFIEDSEKVRDFLINLGFDQKDEFCYEDFMTNSVFQKTEIFQGKKVKIDIQLVQDSGLKTKIQNQLKPSWHLFGSDLTKEMKKLIWKGAYIGYLATKA